MNPTRYWRTIPWKSRAGFLLGVLFISSTVGFISDIMEMGRQPALRFVLSVLLSGGFAMFDAASGFVLRGRLWKAFAPAFILQLMLIYGLGRSLPGPGPGSAGGSRRNRPGAKPSNP